MSKSYTLYIDAYTPETIPMARLAQYMQNLAAILGHEAGVHFETLLPGSTQLVTMVDHEDVPKIRTHLAQVKSGEGSPEATKAKTELDRMLAEDNASGFVYEDGDIGAQIIDFPGIKKPRPTTYGPFSQEGALDGILISVSGADQTVHLQLQNGDIKYTGIDTNRDVARRLAKHMYDPVRIFGVGRWFRDNDGNWLLKRFRVDRYDVLAQDDLKTAVKKMREVGGNAWGEIESPLDALRALRDGSSGLH